MGRAQFNRRVDLHTQTLSLVDAKISQVPSESVEFVNADSATTVNAANNEVVLIEAPTGYLYEILEIYLQIGDPTGGASGTHEFEVYSESETIFILKGKSVFGSVIEYKYGIWKTADSEQQPPNDSEQQLAIRGKRIDSTNGIRIIYANDTDVNQTKTRAIRLWVRKIKVA